jgi:hypothetical protein
VAFGYVLTRSEVLSWFRIQEMFHFQSFRMYGIIGSAVVTAALSVALIKRAGLKSISGEKISIPAKHLGSGIRYAAGGTLFGLGWALTGACPGPLLEVEAVAQFGGEHARIVVVEAADGDGVVQQDAVVGDVEDRAGELPALAEREWPAETSKVVCTGR